MQQDGTVIRRSEVSASILATNKILRNTYALLAMTLLFSAAMAGVAMVTNALPLNPWLILVGYFVLLFTTSALRNSAWGLLAVFALTGFMGYTLGPLINMYLHEVVDGKQLVLSALGGTGAIFLVMSGYALVSKKDFNFMMGFVSVGILVAFLGSLAGLLFHIPVIMLAVSAAFIMLSSAMILIQTSQIVRGGETNYIMATITIYVSLYNIFLSLLNLLSFFNNRE